MKKNKSRLLILLIVQIVWLGSMAISGNVAFGFAGLQGECWMCSCSEGWECGCDGDAGTCEDDPYQCYDWILFGECGGGNGECHICGWPATDDLICTPANCDKIE